MKRTLLTLTLAAALCLPALFAQKSAAEEPIVLTFNLGMPPIHQRLSLIHISEPTRH